MLIYTTSLAYSSLSGLTVAFSHTQSVHKPRRSRRKTKVDANRDEVEPRAKRIRLMEAEADATKECSGKIKKQPLFSNTSSCLQEPSSAMTPPLKGSDPPTDPTDRSAKEEGNVVFCSEEVQAKKSQLVVGVNAVTRQLEQGKLEAGLVCSTSPGMLYQHILSLAATREVPFAAVPDLSRTLARLLGIRKAMCIAWRKVSASDCGLVWHMWLLLGFWHYRKVSITT